MNITWQGVKNKFSRQAGGQVETVNNNGVVAAPDDQTAQAAIYNEQAINQLVTMFIKIPDPDEVLREAGITRTRLRKMMLDDEIAQCFETRLDALLAVPVRLEQVITSAERIAKAAARSAAKVAFEADPQNAPDPDMMDITDPVAAAQTEWLQDQVNKWQREIVSGAFSSRPFGYSVLEAVYIPNLETGYIEVSFMGEKPFEWFEPKSNGELVYYPSQTTTGFSQVVGGVGQVVDQRYKFFLTRSRPSYRQPYGEALLSRLYWAWFFRANGWKFWAKFLERFGSPLLIGKSTNTSNMLGALLSAHSQAALAIDRGDSVESLGLPSGNTGQNFQQFEDAVLRRMQKIILGSTLTSGTDGGSGNRALGQVHNLVRNDKRNSDVQLVQPTMQKFVDALCALNNLPKHNALFADDVGLEAERAVRDKTLREIGIKFKKQYFVTNYNIDPDDFEISVDKPVGLTAEDTPRPPLEGTDPPTPTDPTTGQLSKTSLLFSKDASGKTVFTAGQEQIEKVVDKSLPEAGHPIDINDLRTAIMSASSPEDLETRLFALVGDKLTQPQFSGIYEQALFSAQVIGFVDAAGK